jgi:hypothetical protein
MKLTRGTRIIVWVGVVGVTVLTLAVVLWIRTFHRYTPMEVVQDIRAGLAARHAPQPVERFLELRYGPLTEPANRQKAFLDFFNVGHIEGLQILVIHMRDGERQTNIAAMARWVAGYRRTMSPKEKQALNARLSTADGRRMLQQATAQYLRQDVHYRAATAGVITELMTTVVAVQKP